MRKDGFIKFSSEKEKNGSKKINFEIRFNKDILKIIFPGALVILLTNENFLRFVVNIVKIIMNGSFYYFLNNSFLFYGGVYEYKYHSHW